MAERNQCPFCGSQKSASITAVGGEYVGLIIWRHGAVIPNVCLKCGVVYIEKEKCERIRRAEDGN